MTWTTKRHIPRDIQPPKGVTNNQGSGGSKAKAETSPTYNTPNNQDALNDFRRRRANSKHSTFKKIANYTQAIPSCPMWAFAVAVFIIGFSFVVTEAEAQQ